jgi:DNA modification methylase
MLINGDSLYVLRTLEDNSVDLIVTDPPYGYSFMGKDWDKAVPSTELWKECLRVLKPGAFAFIMSAPRSDVLSRMIVRIEDAGFRVDFSPIYWTYASGFPKAMNIGKMVDKRLGLHKPIMVPTKSGNLPEQAGDVALGATGFTDISERVSDAAKALDGSYGGFQPKPAVEVVIVAMKPLSEKTYVDQALKNGKGITWLDDVRTSGRFPANLLVEDDVLGDHSRFFSLDSWADTLPFLAVAKASKREKGEDNKHPTVKPLKLMSYLITLGSRPGDTILDPFMGSGTTGVAAKALEREFIGIELSEEYHEIATARVTAA